MFFSNAHSLGLNATPVAKTHTFKTTPSNPFTICPKELISEILLYLPLPTLKSLALSGLLPFNLSQNNSFWHLKTSLEFPFLYDLPKLEGDRHWLSIYLELYRQCYHLALKKEKNEKGDEVVVGERDKTLVLGLANRRRVWGICEQIVEVYRECLKELEDEEIGVMIDKSVVEESLSLQMPIVGNPIGSTGKAISMYFISRWEDLRRGLELGFWFEKEEGALCGIEVVGIGTFGRRKWWGDEAVIKEGKWITGMVVNVSGGSENALKDVNIGVTGLEVSELSK